MLFTSATVSVSFLRRDAGVAVSGGPSQWWAAAGGRRAGPRPGNAPRGRAFGTLGGDVFGHWPSLAGIARTRCSLTTASSLRPPKPWPCSSARGLQPSTGARDRSLECLPLGGAAPLPSPRGEPSNRVDGSRVASSEGAGPPGLPRALVLPTGRPSPARSSARGAGWAGARRRTTTSADTVRATSGGGPAVGLRANLTTPAHCLCGEPRAPRTSLPGRASASVASQAQARSVPGERLKEEGSCLPRSRLSIAGKAWS